MRKVYKERYLRWLGNTTKIVVEVGTWRGAWTARLLHYFPQVDRVYCIDPWEGKAAEHYGVVKKLFESEIATGKVILRRTRSEDAAESFVDPIDLLYIDGDHFDVYTDLVAWLPHVRNKGLVLGHDFSGHRQSPAVQRALFRYFGEKVPYKTGSFAGYSADCAQRIHSFVFRKKGDYGKQDERMV